MLRLAALTMILAAPVFAHGGAHPHSHGAETWVSVLLVAALAGMWGLWSRR